MSSYKFLALEELWQSLTRSITLLTQHKKLLALSITADLLFLLAFTIIHLIFTPVLGEQIITITNIVQDTLASSTTNSMNTALLQNTQFQEAMHAFQQTLYTKYLPILMIAWLVFQGSAWHAIARMHSKQNILKFFTHYALITIACFASAFAIIFLKLAIMQTLNQSRIVNTLLIILAIMFADILLSFHAIAGRKQYWASWLLWWKHWKQTIPNVKASLILTLTALLSSTFLGSLFSQEGIAIILFFIIIGTPLLALSRAIVIQASKRLA